MKITKSELKQMIREALREELLQEVKVPVVVKKPADDGWYGADSEVEFEMSVYPYIAKYFSLPAGCKVVYAYWFVDEVTVVYEDASGNRDQIDEHVPLGQVKRWFEAGYTIV